MLNAILFVLVVALAVTLVFVTSATRRWRHTATDAIGTAAKAKGERDTALRELASANAERDVARQLRDLWMASSSASSQEVARLREKNWELLERFQSVVVPPVAADFDDDGDPPSVGEADRQAAVVARGEREAARMRAEMSVRSVVSVVADDAPPIARAESVGEEEDELEPS